MPEQYTAQERFVASPILCRELLSVLSRLVADAAADNTSNSTVLVFCHFSPPQPRSIINYN